MAKLWMLLAVILTAFSAAPASAANTGKRDPCGLLKVEEVEAVTGSLAGPPYRAGARATPRPNGEDCRYETSDRRSIRLNVTWQGGKDFIAMMGAAQALVEAAGLKQLKLLDGSTASGRWDQAAINGCCEFNALRGDQVVTVDVSGSKATIAQAAALADAAIQRLDRPLDIVGTIGIKAAEDRAARRPKPRNVCELLTRADAEAIAGVSLSQPPQGNTSSCTYAWPIDAQGSEYDLKLMVTWQDGFSEMRTTGAAIGNASTMLGMDRLKPSGAAQNGGPWDDFSQSIIGVSAVKGDVMVSVEGGPVRQDVQRAFVEKAVVNLSK
jgi:hypothetical protein